MDFIWDKNHVVVMKNPNYFWIKIIGVGIESSRRNTHRTMTIFFDSNREFSPRVISFYRYFRPTADNNDNGNTIA